jgi:hypothetical protein
MTDAIYDESGQVCGWLDDEFIYTFGNPIRLFAVWIPAPRMLPRGSRGRSTFRIVSDLRP